MSEEKFSDKNIESKNTMKGKVKFFNVSKGFGFIVGDDEKEYFVHMTGLAPGVQLNENDEVSFEVVEGDRGPKAEQVTKE